MRVTCLLCLVLILPLTPNPQQTSPPRQTTCEADEDYSIATVRAAFDVFKGQGVGSPIEVRKLPNLLALGDRVSIAALKIYSFDEIVQSENASAYLTLVRSAFSSKSSVLAKPDVDPKVTLFVLNSLKEKESANPSIEKRLSYTERCVNDFSFSPQSEHDFFKKSYAKVA